MARKPARAIALPPSIVAAHTERFGALYDADATQLLFAIRAVAVHINERANEWLGPFGLTAKTLNYLASLHALGEADVTLKELSALTHSSNAGVTQTIDSLARAGLVRRVPHRDDGRSIIVKLTAKGKRRFEEAFCVHLASVSSIAAAVDASDRRRMMDSLAAINDALDDLPNA